MKERIVVVRRKLQELRGKIPAHFRNPQLMDEVVWRIKAFVPGVKTAEATRATELLLSHLGIPVKRDGEAIGPGTKMRLRTGTCDKNRPYASNLSQLSI